MLASVKTISTALDNLGRRLQKFTLFGKSDTQNKLVAAPYGIDSNCPKDFAAIYGRTSVAGEDVIIGYINKDLLAEVGETRIFSTNTAGDKLKAYIRLKNDGQHHIGGDGDFMVRYNELETAFNQLQADFDDLVSKYNAHIHTTTATVGTGPVGVISPTTSTDSPSTADITPAKIEEIETIPYTA